MILVYTKGSLWPCQPYMECVSLSDRSPEETGVLSIIATCSGHPLTLVSHHSNALWIEALRSEVAMPYPRARQEVVCAAPSPVHHCSPSHETPGITSVLATMLPNARETTSQSIAATSIPGLGSSHLFFIADHAQCLWWVLSPMLADRIATQT